MLSAICICIILVNIYFIVQMNNYTPYKENITRRNITIYNHSTAETTMLCTIMLKLIIMPDINNKL